MKIILHVGMPKTGSSALQSACAKARRELARRGVLYPKSPLSPRSHNFLTVGLETNPQFLPRLVRQKYRGRMDEIGQIFEAWMAEIRAEMAARKPSTLILSGESLFGLRIGEPYDRLGRLLRDLGAEAEIVAYVRRPSDHYVSSVQQIIKASHVLKAVGPVLYRAPLEGFAAVGRINVVKYERAAFPGGDIFRHFIETFVPEAEDVPTPEGDPSVNASISAEGMSILCDYRRLLHPTERNSFTPDSDRLFQAIRAAETAAGGQVRPRLIDSVRDAIDQSSEDVVWLRERFGVVFDGIDYDRVAPGAPAERPARVEDICVVDQERREALLMRAMQVLASAQAGDGADKPRGPSSPAPAKPASGLARLRRA